MCVNWCKSKEKLYTIAAGFFSGSIAIWNIKTDILLLEEKDNVDVKPIRICEDFSSPIMSLDFLYALDEEFMIFSTYENTIFIWDYSSLEVVAHIRDKQYKSAIRFHSFTTIPSIIFISDIVFQ